MSDDVREFFPHLAPQDIYDREQTIRDGVKFYRYFRDVYNKVKEKMLVPEAPPLLVDDKDYDTGESSPILMPGKGRPLSLPISKRCCLTVAIFKTSKLIRLIWSVSAGKRMTLLKPNLTN